ncbi:hypothetical protein CKA32_004209 [Geitlerinema sp. FC II]|nr:hypothetical protein CKA32_004209 [Geitlerinema sp. FC II]
MSRILIAIADGGTEILSQALILTSSPPVLKGSVQGWRSGHIGRNRGRSSGDRNRRGIIYA